MIPCKGTQPQLPIIPEGLKMTWACIHILINALSIIKTR
jgi:hypothetical protein